MTVSIVVIYTYSMASISRSKLTRVYADTSVFGGVFDEEFQDDPMEEEIPDSENAIVKPYELLGNYPNPFNPSTTIRYAIPNVSYVSLRIYDILGREVKTLVNSEQNIGNHSVQWNGDNNYGNKVSSGIYLYKIEAGNFIMTKK